MSMYKVTIHATALRPIGELDGAGELIRSKFLVEGNDVQEASKGVLEKFKAQYVTLVGLQITFLAVSPYNEDEPEPGYTLPARATTPLRRQAE